MDLTEPLEKLIKVGFGLKRDEPVEEIEVELDDEEEEDDEENAESTTDGDAKDDGEGDQAEEIDLNSLDEEMEEPDPTTEEL